MKIRATFFRSASVFLSSAFFSIVAPGADTDLDPGSMTRLSPLPSTPDYVLAPVITEGAPIEALKYDAILPAQKKTFSVRGSNGAVTKELQNSLPFHFAENGRAGNASTISGYTRGAEEIDVNVLGVPLNFPQGGGFNFGSLPQYLWSGSSFQFGPSMGAFDPRGVAGSLSLRLWSSDALNAREKTIDVGAMHSTADLQQFYVGVATGNSFAGRTGYSTDAVAGPGTSFSARLLDQESLSMKLHFIGASQKVKAFQSERSSTSTAEYTTTRGIPVLQIDGKVAPGWLLKTSAFYDNSYLKTEDPLNPSREAVRRDRTHIYQGGFESALIGKDLRVGLGARQIDYHRLTFSTPGEKLLNVQATYAFHPSDRWTLEPTVGGTAVTRFGFNPTATFGARYDDRDAGLGIFSRIGLHNRVPSLLDRYYFVPGTNRPFVEPSPNLDIERVYSSEIGLDHKSKDQSASLIFFLRSSKDTRYYVNYVFAPPATVVSSARFINNGDAYTFGAWQTFDRQVGDYFSFGTRGSFTRARYKTAKTPFLYQPELIGILVANMHDADQRVSLEAANRSSTTYFAGTESSTSNTQLPGYNYTDLSLTIRPNENLTLTATVENLFDRHIEFRAGQRSDVARYFIFAANAQF